MGQSLGDVSSISVHSGYKRKIKCNSGGVNRTVSNNSWEGSEACKECALYKTKCTDILFFLSPGTLLKTTKGKIENFHQ